MNIVSYATRLVAFVLTWIARTIVLAIAYTVGWWVASNIKGLNTDRGTVGMIFALGYKWTSLWYFSDQQTRVLQNSIKQSD
jgi:hypothetical protein